MRTRAVPGEVVRDYAAVDETAVHEDARTARATAAGRVGVIAADHRVDDRAGRHVDARTVVRRAATFDDAVRHRATGNDLDAMRRIVSRDRALVERRVEDKPRILSAEVEPLQMRLRVVEDDKRPARVARHDTGLAVTLVRQRDGLREDDLVGHAVNAVREMHGRPVRGKGQRVQEVRRRRREITVRQRVRPRRRDIEIRGEHPDRVGTRHRNGVDTVRHRERHGVRPLRQRQREVLKSEPAPLGLVSGRIDDRPRERHGLGRGADHGTRERRLRLVQHAVRRHVETAGKSRRDELVAADVDVLARDARRAVQVGRSRHPRHVRARVNARTVGEAPVAALSIRKDGCRCNDARLARLIRRADPVERGGRTPVDVRLAGRVPVVADDRIAHDRLARCIQSGSRRSGQVIILDDGAVLDDARVAARIDARTLTMREVADDKAAAQRTALYPYAATVSRTTPAAAVAGVVAADRAVLDQSAFHVDAAAFLIIAT